MTITLYALAVLSTIAAILYLETRFSRHYDNAWLWASDAVDEWLYRRSAGGGRSRL